MKVKFKQKNFRNPKVIVEGEVEITTQDELIFWLNYQNNLIWAEFSGTIGKA